jgi:CheY-like chemotaxis protein
MRAAPVTILLAEDDKIDVMAVKRAFRELRIDNPLVVANDGVEALDLLRGANGRQKVPHPYLVLVDLNMPRMDGIQFLAELRKDAALRGTIAFVLTTSAADDDRIRAQEKNVAGYILKHQPTRSFIDAVAMLEHYWSTVEFPTS